MAIAEFNALRTEIAGRSSAQHGLLNLSLVATAAIGTIAFSDPARRPVLLVLAVLSCIFSLLYFDHHAAIATIGKYIKNELAPDLRECTAWRRALWREEFVRVEASARTGLAKGMIRFDLPIILAFLVVPVLSTVYLASLASGFWFWAAWSVGVLAEALTVVVGVSATRGWRSEIDEQVRSADV
ncbi:hypothetical protein SK571_14280 [Lentzea sp. BCCO 10_0798]|uniref:Uncharacterized protein n=1 Tax=Lentzea kristufekii TaxID=3095430 RepID=A0ABU4TQI7_9PSEU|nr:hypothetical protein [Lentzea sp. BCCO 10_0798]MDX8050554.1 hypothetical protein [Lentzea sp. BCCO 10_0798]